MRLLTTLISALALVLAFSAAAFADFSADMVTTSPQGSTKGKLYSNGQNGYGGKLIRMEISAGGQNNIMLIDNDKKTFYMLIPDQKMYMKQKYEPNKGAMEKPASKTFIRNDKFDGHPVKVYKAVTNDKKQAIVWEANDLNNFPIKVEIPEQNAVTEYHNVSTKPVDKSKFAVPSGYKEFDMSGMGGFGR